MTPTAESDLAVFSGQYALGGCSNGHCSFFTKVDQRGGTTYPRKDAGWALEISLDAQWAHAIAPGANILLVEADSNSFDDLVAAEDYAKEHAQYVSNSWGGSEFSGETSYDSHFVQSGVSFFVASGDSSNQSYPSTSPNVISVGGTTLTFKPTRQGAGFSSETGWSGSGGGCSAYENKNSAQTTGSVNCNGKRATPNVSLDADPSSGVSVYDTTRYLGSTGWWQVGARAHRRRCGPRGQPMPAQPSTRHTFTPTTSPTATSRRAATRLARADRLRPRNRPQQLDWLAVSGARGTSPGGSYGCHKRKPTGGGPETWVTF